MAERHLDIVEIQQRIPHRPPFLYIDRVLEAGPEKAVAVKNVSVNEPYFQGHFPGRPIMPGVLIGEAMAQTAAFIGDVDSAEQKNRSAATPDHDRSSGTSQAFYLVRMDLQLHHPVEPGDRLELTARLVKRLGPQMRVSAVAMVGRRKVASAQITVVRK